MTLIIWSIQVTQREEQAYKSDFLIWADHQVADDVDGGDYQGGGDRMDRMVRILTLVAAAEKPAWQ